MSEAAQALCMGTAYFVAAAICMIFTRFDGGIAYFWTPTALLLPLLTRRRPAQWPPILLACLAGGIAASSLFGAGPRYAGVFGAASVGEVALGGFLLQRFVPDGRYFDTLRRVALFIVAVGLLMPLVSAFAGAAAAVAKTGGYFWDTWVYWFAVHGLGALVFTPVVAIFAQPGGRSRLASFLPTRGGGVDFLVLLAAVLVDVMTFGQKQLPLLFLPVLPLIVLTVRLRRSGAAVGLALLAAIGGLASTFGLGPVSQIVHGHAQQAVFFQFYLAVTLLTVLPLAAELNSKKWLGDRLRDSEAMFRVMVDRSGDMLFNIAPDGRIRYASSSVMAIGGFKPAALVGRHAADLVLAADQDALRAAHAEVLARPDDIVISEFRVPNSFGAFGWVEVYSRALRDADDQVSGVVSVVRDVSDKKASQARLERSANTDALTGLYNRRVFDDRLDRAMAAPPEARSVACLAIIDLDHFKQVNDRHGHQAGDQVLKLVAKEFRAACRRSDTLARIGGEEFGLILWEMDIGEAEAFCDRLRERIAALAVTASGQRLTVTASIGVAPLVDYPSVPELLGAADRALYRAKDDGRNCLRLAA